MGPARSLPPRLCLRPMAAGEDGHVLAQRLLEAIVRSGASRQVVAASACALWRTVRAEAMQKPKEYEAAAITAAAAVG